ncbi:MAG: TVP38/TMEM64 family protein [Acidobacteriota bacterium]
MTDSPSDLSPDSSPSDANPAAPSGDSAPGASSSAAEPAQKSGRGRLFALVAVILIAAVGLMFGGKQIASEHLPSFVQWVENLGVWGPVAFIVGYIVATVAFVPGSILTLAAGALFGLWKGTLFVFIGSSIGASAAFLIARYLARQRVEARLGDNPRFAAIDRAVGREGGKIVFLMRLSPIFPFNLLNYSLGLTSVPFLSYVLACVGMIPGTFLYVYYGATAGNLAQAVAGGGEAGGEVWIGRILGLVATIAVTWLITQRARRALKEAADV